jgi:hypothetical protein
MTTQILAAAILFMTCAIGVWKWIARLKSEKRRIANEAKKKLDSAVDSGDTSTITTAFDSMRRL